MVYFLDGYSMADIIYAWGLPLKKAVGMTPKLELPQFKVVGYKKTDKVEGLSTGKSSFFVHSGVSTNHIVF